jgi:hypothetical protein
MTTTNLPILKLADLEGCQTFVMSEISRLANCHKNASWNWQRKPDFPKSCGLRKGLNNKLNNVYPKMQTLAWLIRHGKIQPINGLNPDDYLPVVAQDNNTAAPNIDNGMAAEFIRRPLSGMATLISSDPGPRKTIRTAGVWPIV